MQMLFLHALLWFLAAALSTFFAVLAFKHKWYVIGILDVSMAFVELAAMIETIVNYFAN